MRNSLPIQTIELQIAEGDIEGARRALRVYLHDNLPSHEQNGSIAEAISMLASDGALHPDVAVYLIRCLAVPNLLPPSNPANLLFPNLVTLCERAVPQVCRLIGLETKRQTHEKIALLQTVHARVCGVLAPLSALSQDLTDFVSSRQAVLHVLNHSLISVYCQPFSITHLRSGVDSVFSSLSRLQHGHTDINLLLDECNQCIKHQRRFCEENVSFLTQEYYAPFLHKAELSVRQHVNRTRSRFVTSISCRLGENNTLQKRYPLHDDGRLIFISVPLRSTGPGTALAATVKLETDSETVLFVEDAVSLGNIVPGDFSTTCHVFIATPCKEFSFMFTVSWNEVGAVDRKESVFVINVAPQRPDIDWMSLTYRRPYSTEVAKGTDFVGRSEKVLSLANNLLRTPMDSFYITGQKRVGKTSLALAMLDFAKQHEKGAGIESLYLLWGAIAHENPRASLKELGERIARFIQKTFPPEQERLTPEFEGTLATLIPLAETAHWHDSARRYVIVIDEFDEIHPELYMQGNLAETFLPTLEP